SWVAALAGSSPSTRTVPVSACCSPSQIAIAVDLPAPLGPSTAVTRPCSAVSESPSRARVAPKALCTPVSSTQQVTAEGYAKPLGSRVRATSRVHRRYQRRSEVGAASLRPPLVPPTPVRQVRGSSLVRVAFLAEPHLCNDNVE